MLWRVPALAGKPYSSIPISSSSQEAAMLLISSLLPVDQGKTRMSNYKISQFLCCILVFELSNITMETVSRVEMSSSRGGPSWQGHHFDIS